ncbi:flagellar biosynthesis protein FlhB [Polycladidibacter hongkongensis]|uniref:flagellar biosynthesis protein FlhB n=1 Tax=Polycladidibacter hongkongensis TaxID=1647556 RepID=UPI00082F07B5|nr:flagellar biosynthesis protein FlhB [Pseudovibrio hongkongensis]
MAEDQDPESKTEEPTEKKIRDAVEKGDVPVSKEASVLAALVAILLILSFMSMSRTSSIVQFLTWFLDNPAEISLNTSSDLSQLMFVVGLELSKFLLPMVGLLIAFGLASSFLQNTPRMVLTRIQPKLEKISLQKGVKRLFSMNTFMEFIKSLFKLTTVTVVALLIIRSQQAAALTTMYTDPALLPATIVAISMKLLSGICVATIALVGFDLVLARFQWRKKLRMTKQDIKDEFKQSEGDPMVKARQRSIARDRARRSMLGNVQDATVVIANPTHFAVALQYDRTAESAPKVVAKGQDLIALRIKELAYLHDVTVIEDKPLARGLYAAVEVDQFIPPQYYRAVAEIISYVYTKKR